MQNYKRCLNCGMEVEKTVKYCPSCGSGGFNDSSYRQQDEYNYQQQGRQDYPGADVQNNFNPQPQSTPAVMYPIPQKSGFKWWQIVIIILSGALVLFLAFCVVSTAKSQPQVVEFEEVKGSITDNVYVNEWAGFQFNITSAYPKSNEYNYGPYEAQQCGFLSIDENSGRQFVVKFEELPAKYTENAVLNSALKDLKKQFKDAEVEVEVSEYFDRIIAGEAYLSVRLYCEQFNAYEYCCVHIKDDYVILIVLSSDDEAEIINTLAGITNVQ